MFKRWKEVLLVFLLLVLANQVYMPFQLSTKSDAELLAPVVKMVESELRLRGLKFTNANVKLIETLPIKGSVGITSGFRWLVLIIRFDRAYYRSASLEEREALVLHEYGHYLGAEHNDRWMHRGVWNVRCPESVMHPSDDMRGCFWNLRNYYYNEVVQAVLTQSKL